VADAWPFGCCSQTGLTRADRRAAAAQVGNDFDTCQQLLANQGTTCSRTGNPRVCVAENDNPVISPPK